MMSKERLVHLPPDILGDVTSQQLDEYLGHSRRWCNVDHFLERLFYVLREQENAEKLHKVESSSILCGNG